MTLEYIYFEDILFNEINIIKNKNEQIEFLGSSNQDFTVITGNDDIILTQYIPVVVDSKGIQNPSF